MNGVARLRPLEAGAPAPWGLGAGRRGRLALHGAVYALGCVFVFTIPLVNSVTIPSVGTIGKLAGLPFAALGAMTIATQGLRRRLRDTHRLMIAFSLWAAASYAWSIEPGESLVKLVTVLQLLVMLLLLWEFGDGRERQRGFLAAYVLGAYVSLTMLLWQVATNPGELRRYTVSESHPNSISFVLSLAIPAACYLGATEGPRLRAVAFRLFGPLALLGIVLTGSRSALVAGGAAALMLPVTLHGLRRAHQAAAVGTFVVAIGLAASAVPQEPIQRLGSFGSEVSAGDLNGRTELWDYGMGLLAEHPIAGIGVGSARFALERLHGSEVGAHNAYLSVAVDLGVIGLTLFLLALAAALSEASRTTGLERRLLLVTTLTLALGLLPRHWEYERPTWFVIAVLVGLGAATAPRGGAPDDR